MCSVKSCLLSNIQHNQIVLFTSARWSFNEVYGSMRIPFTKDSKTIKISTVGLKVFSSAMLSIIILLNEWEGTEDVFVQTTIGFFWYSSLSCKSCLETWKWTSRVWCISELHIVLDADCTVYGSWNVQRNRNWLAMASPRMSFVIFLRRWLLRKKRQRQLNEWLAFESDQNS